VKVARFPVACPDPRLSDLITAYCFGDISEPQRARLESHLLQCDLCWQQVQALTRHVGILRTEESLRTTIQSTELIGLLGLSGGLDRRFAGHSRFAILGSAAYACLFAVPVLVELWYEFDRYRTLALVLAPPVFLVIFLASLLALHVDVQATRSDAPSFSRPFVVLAASTVLIFVSLLPFLPRTPTVQAAFSTYPVHLGYLKSVFYAWMVGPMFIFWPFHFVVLLQRELASGRSPSVLTLLSGDPRAVPPRGSLFIPVWMLVSYVGGIFVFNWIGLSRLFEGLQTGPYSNLFMALVLVRVTIWLLVAALGTWWYAGSLTELKREALALQAFSQRTPPAKSGPPTN
jgi:hypothetical protein